VLQANSHSAPCTFSYMVLLQDVLFQPEAFKVSSRHHNYIGFSVDLSMLLKALHSAVNNDADVIDMKLTQKPVLVPGGDGEMDNKRFLSITSRVRPGCTADTTAEVNGQARSCPIDSFLRL